ncbi:uncharacterized protein LOC130630607 [Hydractinia symbiolongicarpus]|uniref:uncharacterized protein LOC130630607 n=1 Tax=Hydractinia symbiolongicarpus TaxID=13093 RepID=UPI00254E636E|nr:uncharacterized protein LOC130630607 [Hydractinia symbiolongicarpus]
MFERTRHLPFYQAGIHDRLQFVIHLASYSEVIKNSGTAASGSTAAKPADASYKITNIVLEFDKVTNEELANAMLSRYSRLALPYEHILRSKVVTMKISDTNYNLQIDTPAKSLKGVLLLFQDPGVSKAYAGNNEKFYNPKITSISTTIEGSPNELFSHAMLPKDHMEQVAELFGSHDSIVTIGQYLTERFALFLDFRSSSDHTLQGSGRLLQKLSDGITLHMTKKADGTGDIRCYVYLLMDAQLNILDEFSNKEIFNKINESDDVVATVDDNLNANGNTDSDERCCVLHVGDGYKVGKINLFNTETLGKCKSILVTRKNGNLKYKDTQLPDFSL